MFGSKDKIVDGVTYSGTSGQPKAFSGFEYHKGGKGWKKDGKPMIPNQGAFAEITKPTDGFTDPAFAWFGPVGDPVPSITDKMVQIANIRGPIHLYKLEEDPTTKKFKWTEMTPREEDRQRISAPQFILVTTRAADTSSTNRGDWTSVIQEWRYYGPDGTDGDYPADMSIPGELKETPNRWPIKKFKDGEWVVIPLRPEHNSTAAAKALEADREGTRQTALEAVQKSPNALALIQLRAEKTDLQSQLREVTFEISELESKVQKAKYAAGAAGGRRTRTHKRNLKRRRPSTLKRNRR